MGTLQWFEGGSLDSSTYSVKRGPEGFSIWGLKDALHESIKRPSFEQEDGIPIDQSAVTVAQRPEDHPVTVGHNVCRAPWSKAFKRKLLPTLIDTSFYPCPCSI